MDEIDQIKQAVSIYDLAMRYGAEPKQADSSGAVACRINPLRSEKTSSLFIYPKTNSWFDQGSQIGGSIIDWIMEADGVSPGDAIGMIKSMAGMDMESYVPNPAAMAKPEPKQYLHNHESITKIFSKFIKLTMKDHRTEMLAIAPDYIYKQTTKEHAADFHARIKYDPNYKTSAILVKDGDHNSSIRHRRISEGGEVKKWKALKDAKASVPYVRDNRDDLLLIVEGSHDFLTAILSGYSVIALPQTGFKLDPTFTAGRKCLFIADDDEAGRDGMKKTIAHCAGEGVQFDHDKFRSDNKITTTPKDFSEYMDSFTSLREFQVAIALHVETLHVVTQSSYDEMLDDLKEHVTDELINSMKEIDIMIDGILPRGQITTLVGKPNVGKSAITFAFINQLFENNCIDGLVYLDADNPLMYSAERIKSLNTKHPTKRIYYYSGSSTTKGRMSDILSLLSTRKDGGERVIIVVDSLKNFVAGSINDDKIINPIFDMLQAIRDNFKSTIIVLHHTKKGRDEDGKLSYVGSQVIEASTDNMIMMSRVDNIVKLEPSKMRAMLEAKAYDLDFANMEIAETDMPKEEKEDGKASDEDSANEIYDYLIREGAAVQSTIIVDMMGTVSKAKTPKILWDDRFKNKLWTIEKLSPKGWKFTAIKKSGSAPEVIEYKMDINTELF